MFSNFCPKFSLKSLICLAAILITSCTIQFKEPKPKVRIVGLNGKPKDIKTFVPQGNVTAITEQIKQAKNPQARTESSYENFGNGQPQGILPEIANQVPQINTPNNQAATPSSSTAIYNNNVPIAAVQNTNPAAYNNQTYQQTQPVQNVPTIPVANNTAGQAVPTMPPAAAQQQYVPPVQTPATNQEFEQPQIYSNPATAPITQNPATVAPQPAPPIVRRNIAPIKPTPKITSKDGMFVQIGSFSVYSNANNVLKKSSVIKSGLVEESDLSNGRKIYRVLLGPINSSKEADRVLRQVKNIGYNDAFITR